ncbi:MAG: hypothetical protein Kow00108_21360 [Calditrichia bacterium]
MRYIIPILYMVSSLLLLTNCSYKPQSAGDDDRIAVMMDSVYYDAWQDAIYDIFGTIRDLPNPEREFQIAFYPYEKFREWSVQKNIMMIGFLGGKDSVSMMLERMVNDSLKNKIKNGEYFFFRKRDVYARDQYAMFCIGRDTLDVFIQLNGYKKQMLQEFRNYYYAKLYKQMFARAEQKDLEEQIFNTHDFALRIQHDYALVRDNAEDNFLWLRRPFNDRNIFIHWIEGKGPEFIHPDSLVAERDKIGEKYFEGDYVTKRYFKYFPVTFAGHKALKLEGVWENKKHYIGGPFRMYAFYDEKLDKVFMVDIFAFIPDKRKKVFLDQLEVIASTFRLKYTMNSIEDLWNE